MSDEEKELLEELRMNVIRGIARIHREGRNETDPPTSDFKIALHLLGNPLDATTPTQHPMQAAIEQLRNGRAAGGAMPRLDESDDRATS